MSDIAQESGLTWRRLVLWSAVAATLAIAGVSLYLGDIEGSVVSVVFAVSTWLFWSGRRRIGALGLVLMSGVTAYFMTTAALSNLRGGAGVQGIAISLGLSALSQLVLIATLFYLLRRSERSSFGPWLLLGLVAAGTAAPLLNRGSSADETAQPFDLQLVSENVAFSETELVAASGAVTVALENRDLFWHTFTIEELGVDLRVPVGAEMTVTFDAPPGEYEFFCDIPGHPEAGMVGTLIVDG